jgi:PEP-CTERM motif
MKTFKQKMQVVAVAAALGVAGGAQAGVIGQSVLELSGLVFTSGGSPIVLGTQINGLVFSDSTDITATLNGVSSTTSINTNIFAPLDALQQCVGNCGGFGQNDYTHHVAQTVNVARGDTFLNNAPIINPVQPVGANARSLAEVQVGGGSGSTQSNLGLLSTFTFTALNNGPIGISFNADMYLIAAITANLNIGSNAQASSTWDIDLRNVTTGARVFRWAPDGILNAAAGEISDPCALNDTIAAQIPGTSVVSTCVGAFSAQTNNLVAGNVYTLNIRHNTLADATAVPEPESLGLLGIGLLGLVAGLRRRKAKVVA